MRALDDPRDVGDDEGAIVGHPDDAEVRLEGRERIVGDLGARGRDHREQCALAGIGLTEQADVGDQLEDELEASLFAFFSWLPFARRLMRRRRKVLIAAPAAATLRDEQRLALLNQLAEDFPRLGVADFGSRGDWQEHIVGRFAGHVLSLPVLPAFGPPVRVVAIIEEGGEIRVCPYEDASSNSAIPTIRTTLRHKLLTTERAGPGAAGAGADLHDDSIYEHRCLTDPGSQPGEKRIQPRVLGSPGLRP